MRKAVVPKVFPFVILLPRSAPGRGHHANLRAGDLVRIDPDLWAYFGSAEAVNQALRDVVAERRGR